MKSKPLYVNDGKCIEPQLPLRMQALGAFKSALEDGTLEFIDNKCLCHNEHPENDIIISEKDRYGIAIPQVICSKCGLIRSGKVLDETSNRIFYEEYYRKIYLSSGEKPAKTLFENESKRGKTVLNLIKKYISPNEICSVAEVGCGAGGCLLPFKEAGMMVSGYDYDHDYLEYGKSMGLSLYYGDFYQLSENNHFDLILLNHVLEHFLDPIKEIKNLFPKVKTGKYMYVEVPGIFNIHNDYYNPLRYFQNAHVYNYFKDYLITFFEQNGFDILYGDERCRFIVRKNTPYSKDVEYINSTILSDYPHLINNYLRRVDKFQYYYKLKSKIRGILKKVIFNVLNIRRF